jgi:hypothetical protein
MTDMIRGLTTRHCHADQWAPEVIACFLNATTPKVADACGDQLTKAQREALEGDAERQLPTAAPPPPPPAPPPPGAMPMDSHATGSSKASKKAMPGKEKEKAKGDSATGNPCDGGD